MQQRFRICFLSVLVLLSGCVSLVGKENAADVQADKIKVAEQLYSDGNFDAAEKLFIEIDGDGSSNAQVLYRLGNIYYRKGDVGKAASYFESVIKIDPRNPKAHFNLATIRLMQAEEHFKYYVATVDPKTEIDRLSTLIGAIEEYASSDNK